MSVDSSQQIGKIVSQADKNFAVTLRSEISVIIHILAGIGQLPRTVLCKAHGILLAFSDANCRSQRIDFLIFFPAQSARLSSAEQEKLCFTAFICHYAKQIIGVICLMYLINTGSKPRIYDLRVQLAVLFGHRLKLLCAHVLQR